MLYTGLFKRIIPFVLTFAAGLFIASFFVSIALPSLGNWREGRRSSRHCHDKRQVRMEMEELREKVRSLKRENEELRRNSDVKLMLENAVPPVELEAPHPPRRPRHPRQ